MTNLYIYIVLNFGSDEILETMQKHLKRLNARSIVLCFVNLVVLDIHVFGQNAMETKF